MYTVKAQTGCYDNISLGSDNAQNLANALVNVSCPVNTGYIQLLNYNNISSILPSSRSIITTLQYSTAYLNKSGNIGEVTGVDIWRGPVFDVPWNFQNWASQLVFHKSAILKDNIGSSLSDGLVQQRDAAEVFIDLVVSKLHNNQHGEVKSILSPVLRDLDCAIAVFSEKSGSASSACPATSAISSGLPSSTAPTARLTSTSTRDSMTSTSSTSSSAATGSSSNANAARISSTSYNLLAGCAGVFLYYYVAPCI
jgi:hypothetical protein